MKKVSSFSQELDRRKISNKQKRMKIAENYFRAILSLFSFGGALEKFIFGLVDAERAQVIDDNMDILFENTGDLRLRTLSLSHDLEKIKAEIEELVKDKIINIEKVIKHLTEFKAKKLIKPYNDVMKIDAEKINPLLDWPILNDLESREKSEVYVDEDKLFEIDQKLTNLKNRRILLKGLGGRGKTVISRLFAYKKQKENWKVYFIDLRELGSSDIEMDTVIDQINKTIINCIEKTLFIFENAHLYDDVTHKLVKFIDNIVDKQEYTSSHFMFNSRDVARDEDLNPFANWKTKGFISLVSPNSELIEKILNKFILAHDIKYTLSQDDRNWIKTTIEPARDSAGIKVGGDLRLLRLFLFAWFSNTDFRLCDLQEKDVIKNFKKFILIDELSRETVLADLLGKVSSVFQFDVPFYGRRIDWSDSRDYLIDLEALRTKGKIKYLGADFYTITHSLDAYYITICLADHNNLTHSKYTGNKIVEYISELPNQPANIIVENLVQLFRAFYNSQQNFEKDVFIYIFSNARDRIISLITDYCEGLGDPGQKYHEGLGILSRILNLVEIYLGKDEAFAFWNKVCSHIKPEAWLEIFIRNKPFYIALLLQILIRISSENEQRNQTFKFLYDNFGEIYKFSTLHKIGEIFRPLPRPVVNKLKEKMKPDILSKKIIESKPIHLEFILKQLDDEFMKKIFEYIKYHEWDYFLQFFRRLEGKNYPITLIDRIRSIDAELANNLRNELKSFFEDLKIQNRKRDLDGRLLINNKIANNYSNPEFSNENFRKYLSANFENNFIITISNIKILKRLLNKIYYSTYNYPEREQGGKIIGQIIYQLSDDIIKHCCSESELLGIIEKTNKAAYEYLCNKCKDLY